GWRPQHVLVVAFLHRVCGPIGAGFDAGEIRHSGDLSLYPAVDSDRPCPGEPRREGSRLPGWPQHRFRPPAAHRRFRLRALADPRFNYSLTESAVRQTVVVLNTGSRL